MTTIRGGAMAVVLVGMTLVNACVDSSAPSPPAASVQDVLSTLTVNQHGAVMAVGDTLAITVTARNLLGETIPIDDSIPVVWTSSEPRTVTVDAQGHIRALAPTSSDAYVNVAASWTSRSSTKTDTVVVNVTPTRNPIAGIRIRPTDSTRTSTTEFFLEAFTSFAVTVVDANGGEIGQPYIPVTVDSTIAVPQAVFPFFLGQFGVLLGADQYLIISRVIGDYWVYAGATIYGVPMRDSLKFTGLYPANVTIPIVRDSASRILTSKYNREEVSVQPCAEVKFQNTTDAPLGIAFDDPSRATGCVPGDLTGNIDTLGVAETVVRKFRPAGTVRWTVRNIDGSALLPTVSGTVSMREP